MSQTISLRQKEEIVISYNKLAMEQLQQENYDNSLSYLKQALMGIKGINEEYKRNKLMAVTYNNLGIFFKRMANYPEALKYLYKAVDLDNKLPNEIGTISGAHLNICSILSQQGDHNSAIRHGLRSIFLLKAGYKIEPKLVTTLIVAYYNVANEYSFIGQQGDAEDCLKIGYKISLEELGPQHHLTNTLKGAFGNYSRKLSPNYERFGRGHDRTSLSPKTNSDALSAKSRSTSQENTKFHSGSGLLNEKQKYRNADFDIRTKKTSRFGNDIKGQRRMMEIKRPVINKDDSDDEKYRTEPMFGSVTSNSKKKIDFIKGQKRMMEIKRPALIKDGYDEEKYSTKSMFGSASGNSKKIDLNRHKETERIAATLIQSWWRGCKARKHYKELLYNYKLKQAEIKARRAVEEYEKLKQQAAKINKKYK